MTEGNKPANDKPQDGSDNPIIESASATTSPDNRSGVAPLVIVGVALAVALLLCYGIASFAESIITLALRTGFPSDGYSYESPDGSDSDDALLDEFDRLLDDYLSDRLGSGPNMNGTGHDGSTGSQLATEDVRDLMDADAQVIPSVAGCLAHASASR